MRVCVLRWLLRAVARGRPCGGGLVASEDLAIGEVARQAGIQPPALRYYESIGLLPAPKRTARRRSQQARACLFLN